MSLDTVYIPSADDLAGWVRILDNTYYSSTEEMLYLHEKLHETFGAKPSDAVLQGEQKLSTALRSIGIEHRYTDALSVAAKTVVENPVAPSLEEMRWYIKDIMIHAGAVKLLQGVEEQAQLYITVDESMLPEGSTKSILKQVNKMMPPGVTVKLMPKVPKEEYIREMRILDLELSDVEGGSILVTPWKQVIKDAPDILFKSDAEGNKKLAMKVSVAKAATRVDAYGRPMRFILGPVLFPEEEDSQKEIYSHVEVEKACHWFAEHSRNLSLNHVLQGGKPLDSSEMVMVENYVMPIDGTINGTHIKAGTWMMGANAYGEEICTKIDKGEMNTWSIGAEALSWIETVEVSATA